MFNNSVTFFGSCVFCSKKVNPPINIIALGTYLLCLRVNLLVIFHFPTSRIRVQLPCYVSVIFRSMFSVFSGIHSCIAYCFVFFGVVHSI